VFYFLCGLIGLFCVVALGYGPLFFVLLGVALAIVAFRRRLRNWWGLPLSASGLVLVLAVALGWGWQQVVGAFALAFVVVALARVIGRTADRRSEAVRR
jgi:lysylphosphatidylglycerol synthetase-like protein (DUF2156 family)